MPPKSFMARAGYRSVGGPVHLAIVGIRAGKNAMKSVASMQLSTALSPFILSESFATNFALSGNAQIEAAFFVVNRIAVRSPRGMSYILNFIARAVSKCAPTGSGALCTTSWLAKQSFRQQVTLLGLRGSAASAIVVSLVQLAAQTLHLVKKSAYNPSSIGVSVQQYYYDSVTIFLSGGASVLGSGLGAVLGFAAAPGIGTVIGSSVGACVGGFVLYVVRSEGPEVEHQRALRAAEQRCNPDRALKVVQEEDWLIITDCEGESRWAFYDVLDPSELTGPLEADAPREAEWDHLDTDVLGVVEEEGDAKGDFEFIYQKDLQRKVCEAEMGEDEIMLIFVPCVVSEGADL